MAIETVTKALLGKEDISLATGDTGAAETFTREDSQTRTLTLTKLDASHLKFRSNLGGPFSVEDLVDGGNDVSIGVNNLTVAGSLTASTGSITAADLTATDDLTVNDDATIAGTLTLSALSNGVLHATGGTGTIASSAIVNADVDASAAIAATKIANGAVSNTEFQYLDGVTSAIQTQLDAKLAIASLASQSDQETGTSTTTWVAPGRQHFHLSACKCFVKIDGTATPANYVGTPYNVTSITDNGTGDYTINIGTDFSDTTYAYALGVERISGDDVMVQVVDSGQAAGTLRVEIDDRTTGTMSDSEMSAIMFGDQP